MLAADACAFRQGMPYLQDQCNARLGHALHEGVPSSGAELCEGLDKGRRAAESCCASKEEGAQAPLQKCENPAGSTAFRAPGAEGVRAERAQVLKSCRRRRHACPEDLFSARFTGLSCAR